MNMSRSPVGHNLDSVYATLNYALDYREEKKTPELALSRILQD
jgi:hypothetical protein